MSHSLPPATCPLLETMPQRGTEQVCASSRSRASVQLNLPPASAQVNALGTGNRDGGGPSICWFLPPWLCEAVRCPPAAGSLPARCLQSLPPCFPFPCQLPTGNSFQKRPGLRHCFVPPQDHSAAEVTHLLEDLTKPPAPQHALLQLCPPSSRAAARKSEDKRGSEGGKGQTMPPLPFIVVQWAG